MYVRGEGLVKHCRIAHPSPVSPSTARSNVTDNMACLHFRGGHFFETARRPSPEQPLPTITNAASAARVVDFCAGIRPTYSLRHLRGCSEVYFDVSCTLPRIAT
jgi:hypothetical protein